MHNIFFLFTEQWQDKFLISAPFHDIERKVIAQYGSVSFISTDCLAANTIITEEHFVAAHTCRYAYKQSDSFWLNMETFINRLKMIYLPASSQTSHYSASYRLLWFLSDITVLLKCSRCSFVTIADKQMHFQTQSKVCSKLQTTPGQKEQFSAEVSKAAC